jgi:hypothetical protein
MNTYLPLLKKHLPYIVLGLLILIGAYLLLTDTVDVSIEKTTSSESATTTEDTNGESVPTPSGGGTGLSVSSDGSISVPPGLNIVKQTAWATFTDPDWALSFKYQKGWEVTKADGKDGTLAQASIATPAFTILIQEDMDIAEPAIIEPRVSTETIAGQRVEVHEYLEPREGYAYYLYFTLSDGNDDFNFSIRAKTDEREEVNDFIERLSMAK